MLAALAAVLCAGPGSAAPPGEGIDLERCHVRGRSQTVLCGELEVPENRSPEAPADGRRLTLDVVVVPAQTPSREPEAVFVLAGGPGQAATALVPLVAPILSELNRSHDLVFVDQRGTGVDDPMRCEDSFERLRAEARSAAEEATAEGLPDDPSEEGPTLEEQFLEGDVPALLAACLEDLDADPRQYTTPISMDDVDDARAALGYEKIHLWGGSYGTRAALVYLDRHPEHVATAVIDGLAPVEMALPSSMAIDAERAFGLLAEACTEDAACSAAFPDPRGRLAEVLARLEEAQVEITVDHPLTGEPTDLVLTRGIFAGYLRAILYDASASRLIPLVVEQAARGDYDPFVALSWQAGGGGGAGLSFGLFLSVVCAEDRRVLDEEAARAEAEGTFFGTSMLDVLVEACETWPAGEVPEDYFEPVASDLPILAISGDLDPVTPPRWGERVVGHLSRATHVVVPATGHGTLRAGCAADLVTEFIRSDGAGTGPTDCLERLRRPRFFVDVLGPGPVETRSESSDGDPTTGDAPEAGDVAGEASSPDEPTTGERTR